MPRDNPADADMAWRIRQAREKQGLSRQAAANAIGVHRGTLEGWETGRGRPPLSRLPAICKGLNVPAATFTTNLETHQPLADLLVSHETLKDIANNGRTRAKSQALRLASLLEPLLYAAACPPAAPVLARKSSPQQVKARIAMLQERRKQRALSERAVGQAPGEGLTSEP